MKISLIILFRYVCLAKFFYNTILSIYINYKKSNSKFTVFSKNQLRFIRLK